MNLGFPNNLSYWFPNLNFEPAIEGQRRCVTTEENIQLVAFTNVVDDTLTPSTNWQDFNKLYNNYLKISSLSKFGNGIISNNCIIEPDPTDYPNY